MEAATIRVSGRSTSHSSCCIWPRSVGCACPSPGRDVCLLLTRIHRTKGCLAGHCAGCRCLRMRATWGRCRCQLELHRRRMEPRRSRNMVWRRKIGAPAVPLLKCGWTRWNGSLTPKLARGNDSGGDFYELVFDLCSSWSCSKHCVVRGSSIM